MWCLLGAKAGDNTQVMALANALEGLYGFSVVQKQIRARRRELLVHLGHRATLWGIDKAASSALEGPWPDVVISAGRRNEPVAQWIRQRSGGRSRLVHFGRPWAPLDQWDLLVTTPQYFLPQQRNVIHNALPLHDLDVAQLADAGDQLVSQMENVPRPWIALLMGGDSGHFVMTPEKGAHLGRLTAQLAALCNGTVVATDSPRTPRAAGDAMQRALDAGSHCFRFGGGGSLAENPYRGLLAQADAFVVTGESMSMLAEAVDTGRPLFVFDVSDGETPWWRLPHSYRYKPLSFRLGMALAPRRMRRDVGRIQQALIADGAAQWLSARSVSEQAAQLSALPSRESLEFSPLGSAAAAQVKATAERVRQLVINR